MARSNQSENVTVRELYTLVDDKINGVDGSIKDLSIRVLSLEKQVANQQGRQMMVPSIISIGFGVFFFVMSFVLSQLGK